MKYDEKALEAAWQAMWAKTDNMGDIFPECLRDAISAYCEKAGVVMVPRDPTDEMVSSACMDGLRSARSGHTIETQVHAIYAAMIRASQEEE